MHWLLGITASLVSFMVSLTSGLAIESTNTHPHAFRHPVARHVTVTNSSSTNAVPVLTELQPQYTPIPQILLNTAGTEEAAAITALATGTSSTPVDKAVVNIYCQYRNGNVIKAVTGTGFIISHAGVILTNAHVAEYLLLDNVQGKSHCMARTGSPATPAYQLTLLYISPTWILHNSAVLTEAHPSGTGERDYALLYISSGINNAAIPATFPAVSVDLTPLTTHSLYRTVVAHGYPAATTYATGDLSAPLLEQHATTSIGELMTFGNNHADVMTLGGTPIGQQGISGGAVTDTHGRGIGLISTRGDDAKYGSGSLRAITLDYVNRTIKEETGVSLATYLSGDLTFRAKIFSDTMTPILKMIINQHIGFDTASSTK